MLEVLRRSQRWVMGAVIFFVGAVFVAYLGVGGGRHMSDPAGDAVVQLDHRRYSLQDLERVREDQERRLRDSLGDSFDPAAASAYLDQLAAEQIIQRAVLASEAERVGLRATEDEIRQVVRSAFRSPEGTIDAASARAFAERRFGSEQRFAEEVRDDLLYSKLLQLIDAGVEVSDAEARDALRYQGEQVRLAVVVLDPSKRPEGLTVDDADVEKMLAEQPTRVRQYYDQHPERYHVPERVRARHILLRIPSGASDQEIARIRKRAEAVLARVRSGEDFATVAREVSEDTGSKDRGGDLGFFPRGQMAPAFEQAAFSLEPGQTSDLVRTDFGFHVIRVEAHEPAKNRSFDEVAREIAEELVASDRARELAAKKAEELADAVRGGSSLVDAARAADVSIERPDWFSRRPDGYVPKVGPAPDVMTAAFALTPEHPSLGRVFDVSGKKVLIELLERRGPSPEELADQLAAERKRLLESRQAEARTDWYRQARQRLLESGRLRIDLSGLRSNQPQATG
jgi:peptidyl-prolyl cis-trans isomerase D